MKHACPPVTLFRKHFFQHAGFRYVSSDTEVAQPDAYYESDRLLTEYAEFHFGDSWHGVRNFPLALSERALEAMAGKPARKALDLGCACGRASFELAKHFDAVDGVDFSANFIRLGTEMAEQGSVRYARTEEGDLVSYHTRSLKDLELDKTANRVSFQQGDACNLKPHHKGYDLVLAANLIDRLYKPKQFLCSIHERINDGGVLLIASPYTWMEEHTPKEEWIGGFKKDGEDHTTLDGLKELLTPEFSTHTGAREGALCDPRDPAQVPTYLIGSDPLGTTAAVSEIGGPGLPARQYMMSLPL